MPSTSLSKLHAPHGVTFELLKSTDIRYILSSVRKGDLLILDIDDTVGRVSQTIGLDAWFRYRIAKYISEGHSDAQALEKAIVLYHLAQLASTQMIHVEKDVNIAHLIQDLKKKGVKVIGLTARNHVLMAKTRQLLQSIGVGFSEDVLKEDTYLLNNKRIAVYKGCIFANGTNKGVCLEESIRRGHFMHPIHAFRTIHFVDDGEKNCQAVKESLTRLNLSSSFIWHYHYAETHLHFDDHHKKRAELQEAHLLTHQSLLSDEEADKLRAIAHLEAFGGLGRRIVAVIKRLDEGQKSCWNMYMINSKAKLKCIINAVNSIHETEDLNKILDDQESNLYQALNRQRLFPVTFFGRVKWNQARSLIFVRNELKM